MLVGFALDGELSEEAKQRLERHCLRCAQCAHKMRALEKTRSMLREAVPPVELSAAFLERVQARLHAHFESQLLLQETPSPVQWALPFTREEP